VEGFHTYFVGATVQVLVHNACASPSELADQIPSADRVSSGLKADAYHRGASFVSPDQLAAGQTYALKNGNTLLQTVGGMNGKTGVFEYIVDDLGQVTHQMFKPGGTINGIPLK
jgi:hypothetical protein